MAVIADGRPARTRYELWEDLGDYSLLSVSPETGRTHQIRVHLAWLGVPVAGDLVYSHERGARRAKSDMGLERQFLHAWRLSFERPGGKGTVSLEAPLRAVTRRFTAGDRFVTELCLWRHWGNAAVKVGREIDTLVLQVLKP
jgi:23S rRNA pseudouridine1911/1915/1917 synthase